MNRKNFFLLCLVSLVLFSVPLTHAATEGDFVKIRVDEQDVYTNKEIVNSRYLLATDKIFYGSKEGTVFVDVFLKDKVASGFYKIGLQTQSKGVTIKSIRINNGSIAPILSSKSTSYIYPALIFLDGNVTKVRVEISFDPIQIGLREEFDLILYDGSENELLRNDPFLSGFTFRQQITLNTDGISLSGDVTTDHAIWIHIPSTNTDFWTNHTFTDANGMDFTQSDETTLLNWDVEGFDATNDDANIWVNFTPTFSSTFDSNLFIYYGGADTDNSDGTATYPSALDAVYHSNDVSGGTTDSTSNAANMIAQNTPTFGVDGQIDAAIDYQAGDEDYQKTSTKFTGTSGSISGWFNFDVNTSNQTILGGGDEASSQFFTFQMSSDSFIEVTATTGSTNQVHGQTILFPNVWHHGVVTSNGSTWVLYINGVAESLVIEQGSNTGEWFDDVSTMDNSTIAAIERSSLILPADGTIDEVKVFTSTLTADDVRILFNSENDSFITFGSQQSEFLADFNFTVTPVALDQENGINSVIIDLNDLSTIGGKTIADWNYFIDGTRFYTSTVDGNTSRTQLTSGDFNISLIIRATDDTINQKDKTVTVGQLPQGMDLNFSYNTFTTANADVNFGVTFTGSADSFNWGFPGDNNVFTRNAQKTYTTSGQKTVCLTTTTSDINKTVCENFFVGRVLVRIPKDIATSVSLSPFDFTVTTFPFQSYTGLSADTNVFVFNDTTNFDSLVSVDFNADYFSASRTFTFNSFFHDYQAYLVENNGINLEATIFTINNPKGRISVSGIRIDSFTDINGVSTLVESKFSDGTGQGIFHFVKGDEYTLNFYDADGVLLMSQTIEANNTEFFAYLELGALSLIPTTFLTVAVDWNPIFGSVVPDADGNVSFWQLLRPTNGTIGDVNVFISHISDTNIIYNQVFTVNSATDFNLSFDLNVAGFNDSFPLNISLQIFDSNSVQVASIRTKSYGFKDTGFVLATERAKDSLGQFGVTLVALILTVAFIGYFTVRATGEDTNMFVIPTMFLTGMAFLIGWIPFDIWTSGVLFGIGMTLWSVKK